MKAIVWVYIGRMLFEQWLSLNPADQASLIKELVDAYCEKYSCSKVELMVKQFDTDLEFFAKCKEWEL